TQDVGADAPADASPIELPADEPAAQDPAAAEPVADEAPAAAPVAAAATPASRPVGCEYEPGAAPLRDLSRYTTGIGYDGRDDAPVTIVKIFDPNCPHCRHLHGTLDALVGQYGGKAKFYYFPFALWNESIPQIEALYVAGESDKFAEMLAGQFAMQETEDKRLLSIDDLVTIAESIDLDGASFRQRLTSGTYAMKVASARNYASVDISREGRVSVPKLTINGQFVANTAAAFSADCISSLIDEAHAEVTE
ncbi:MAG: thioredoxin domain-containing protein, partial [Bacteroidota bacterium]